MHPTPGSVFLYGINVLLASLTLSLLIFYVAKEPGLVAEEVADEDLRRMYRWRWASIGVNVFALLMAVVAPLVAVALYLVTTLLALALPLLGLGWRRHRSRAT
jgi:di/tricarboxylate transporter